MRLLLLLVLAQAPPPEALPALPYFKATEYPVDPAMITVGATHRFAGEALTYSLHPAYGTQQGGYARNAARVVVEIMRGGSNPVLGFALDEVPWGTPSTSIVFLRGTSCTLHDGSVIPMASTDNALPCPWIERGVPDLYLPGSQIVLRPTYTSTQGRGLILHELAGHMFGVWVHRNTPIGSLWVKNASRYLLYSPTLTPEENVAAHPEWEYVRGAVYPAMRWVYSVPAGTVIP